MKSLLCYFLPVLVLLGCTVTIPDLPIRETAMPVTVSIFVDGIAVNKNPNSGFMKRIRSDMTRTRMAIPVQPGEASQLLLHVHLSRKPNQPATLSWWVTDYRKNVVQSGQKADAILGTGLDENMVSRLVLNEFSKIDLLSFSKKPKIIFIRNDEMVATINTSRPSMRSFPKSETVGAKDYAVVIGIENYREKFTPVRHAENDARQFEEMLKKTFNIPASNIKILLNDRASKSDIVAALYEWLPKHTTTESRIFVFFSGYGSPNLNEQATRQTYLLPYDGTPAYLATGGMLLSQLEEHLASLEGKNAYLFLDTSFSGSGEKSISPDGIRPVLPSTQHEAPSPIFVFSASGLEQKAHVFDKKRQGVFTHFLLSGLSGGADENLDKSVEISELNAYLESKITTYAATKNIEQKPSLRSPADADLNINLVNNVIISGHKNEN